MIGNRSLLFCLMGRKLVFCELGEFDLWNLWSGISYEDREVSASCVVEGNGLLVIGSKLWGL